MHIWPAIDVYSVCALMHNNYFDLVINLTGEEKSSPIQIKAKPTEGAESAITVVKPTESESRNT